MIDERLIEYANDLADNCVDWYTQDVDDSYIIDSLKAVVAEQKAIDKAYYKELIDMLIDELWTSRAYHLGITGLDSDAEIARKEQEGNTALIRGIDRTIKYVSKAMEE